MSSSDRWRGSQSSTMRVCLRDGSDICRRSCMTVKCVLSPMSSSCRKAHAAGGERRQKQKAKKKGNAQRRAANVCGAGTAQRGGSGARAACNSVSSEGKAEERRGGRAARDRGEGCGARCHPHLQDLFDVRVDNLVLVGH
eukprot:2741909-Prymnesium_polylepis.1